jgi:hypothetical protein
MQFKHKALLKEYTKFLVIIFCFAFYSNVLNVDLTLWEVKTRFHNSRHVGGRGRPKDDSIKGEKTQSFPCIYDVKQVQAAEESQRRTAVSSKYIFSYTYTIHAQTLLTIALPSHSFHLLSPLTVTFPELSVILSPLYCTIQVYCRRLRDHMTMQSFFITNGYRRKTSHILVQSDR